MKDFWTLSTGSKATGDETSSFVGSFAIIPDGTIAAALIKDFIVDVSGDTDIYKVTYKLSNGEYRGREVTQKIKCFDKKEATADRAVNMMKRLFDLCGMAPEHLRPPTEQDIAKFRGKMVGIKVSEWSMLKEDGTTSQGNYVSEVHGLEGLEPVTGTKLPVKSRVETAFSRNQPKPFEDDDLAALF